MNPYQVPAPMIERYKEKLEIYMSENPQKTREHHLRTIPQKCWKDGLIKITTCAEGTLLWYYSCGLRRLGFYISKSNQIISVEYKLDEIIEYYIFPDVPENSIHLK